MGSAPLPRPTSDGNPAETKAAEAALTAFGLPKNLWAGASYWAESGENLPNAYKYKTTNTHVTIERRSSAWYLVSVKAGALFPKHTPKGLLTVTLAQADEATKRLLSSVRIAKAEEIAA